MGSRIAVLLLTLAIVPVADAVTHTPAAKPKLQVRYGGTLVVASGDPGPLNPAITSSGQAHPVTGQIFNGLVRLDRDFTPQPDLARRWKLLKDRKTYVFYLAKNVKWHDGVPFTSADVKYTYEQVLLKLHPRTRTLADLIQSITTPNKYIVVFRLKQPYAPFLRWLDEENGAILPKHLYEGTDPLTNPANLKPVGTGPFKFQSYTRGVEVVLVRNKQYFKPGLPRLDKIVFRVMPSPQAEQAFEAGEVDLFMFPSGPDVLRLRGRKGITITERGREANARVVPLILNLRRKPFGDVRVRQAMDWALDKKFIARTAYAGQLGPATSPLTKHIRWAYTSKLPQYPRNLARARTLLNAAGLPPGSDGIRFHTSLIYDSAFQRQAEIIKSELGDVGIDVDLKLMEFNTWVRKLYTDWDYDMGYTNFTHPPDPDIGWKRIYVCSNIVHAPFTNGSGYCNRTVDRLFAQAQVAQSQKARARLYRRLQQILARDLPVIPLADGIGPWIWRDTYRGFDTAGAKGPFAFGEKAWWTKGSVKRKG